MKNLECIFINIPFKCNNRKSKITFITGIIVRSFEIQSHIAGYGNGMFFDVLSDRVF